MIKNLEVRGGAGPVVTHSTGSTNPRAPLAQPQPVCRAAF